MSGTLSTSQLPDLIDQLRCKSEERKRWIVLNLVEFCAVCVVFLLVLVKGFDWNKFARHFDHGDPGWQR